MKKKDIFYSPICLAKLLTNKPKEEEDDSNETLKNAI